MSLKLARSGPETSTAPETVTAESLGRQLRAILPPIRLFSLSLYNAEGDVLWLSEGALGPDEHGVVLDAIQALHAEMRRGYHETSLEDGRFAMFLPVRAPRGDLVGIVMLLNESRAIPAGLKEQLAGTRVRAVLQKIAVFLRVGSTRAGETMPSSVLSTGAVNVMPDITPDARVDEILTLELEADPDATLIAPPSMRRTAQANSLAPRPEPPEPGPVPPVVDDGATVIAPSFITQPEAKVSSAGEVAADLALSVQELVKMRSSGRTRRFEVLARSRRDAARNEVPEAFVASAASGRDGAALDGAVVDQLLEWIRRHPQVWDGEPASFSINVSVGALEDPAFLEAAKAAILEAGVPANALGFEITEFACIQCKSAVQRFIAECERMGCFVVLDNFTFDSAALSLLGSSAVRMVKIDPKLSAAAMKEKLPQAIVTAILQACKVLGVHCIAKNVETQAALDWLEAIGCDFAQGFALEKPLSLESLASPAPALPRVRAREGKAGR